jgi:hypothetical protein
MILVRAYEWLRERAEDLFALFHFESDTKPRKRDRRNGL